MSDQDLVGLVLEFVREMNALQRRYGSLMPQSRREGRMDVLLNEYREEAERMYGRWLTRRNRSCYKALSNPPTFSALEKMTLSTVERRGNRAVVELLTSGGCLDFQFNLFCKAGEWRINSFKQRYHSEHRIYHWVYGDF